MWARYYIIKKKNKKSKKKINKNLKSNELNLVRSDKENKCEKEKERESD